MMYIYLSRFKNFFLPLLLAIGLTGAAAESFAAKATHHKEASSKAAKKKGAKAKKSKKATHKESSKKHHKTERKTKDKSIKAHKPSNSSHKSSQGKAHSKDKIIDKRADGRPIYEGPRGGRYYINDAGNKVYLK